MNRSIFILAAVLQLLSIHSLTAAQSDLPLSVTVSSPCASTSQGTITKRHPPAAEGSITAQTIASDQSASVAKQTNALEVPKPLQLEFYGLKAEAQRIALRHLCEKGALSTKQMVNVHTIETALREMLLSRGFAEATVRVLFDYGSLLRIFVDEGPRLPLAEIRFEGNRIFSDHELRGIVNGFLKRAGERTVTSYDEDTIEYCTRLLANHLRSLGYLQAKVDRNTQLTKAGYVVSFTIDTGSVYRLGKVRINGGHAFTEEQIRSKLTIREGEIASAQKIATWLFTELKNLYGDMGFIQYTAEPVPTFKRKQGIVDFDVEIDEGKKFSLRSMSFVGHSITNFNLESVLGIRAGDTYNESLFRQSIARLNELGLFEPIDADADVDWSTDEENAELALVIKLKKRQ